MKNILKLITIASFASSLTISAQAQTKSGNCSTNPGKYRACTYSGTPAEQHMKALGVVAAGIIGLGILGAMAGAGETNSTPAKESNPVDETTKRNQKALNNAELILKLLE